MKEKVPCCLNIIVFSFVCLLAATGCVNKTAAGDATSQKAVTGKTQESKIVRLIEQGKQAFLLPMEDGYLYPVTVLKPIFIETMPMQIKIRFHHQQRDASVPVEMLQLSQFSPCEIVPVEAWLDDTWHLLHGAHRFQGKFLGQPGSDVRWQSFSDEAIRIKIIKGE